MHVAKFLRMTIPTELLEQENFRQAQKKIGRQMPPERRPDQCTSRSLMTNVLDMDDDELLVAAEYELGILAPPRKASNTGNHVVRPTNGPSAPLATVSMVPGPRGARPMAASLSANSFACARVTKATDYAPDDTLPRATEVGVPQELDALAKPQCVGCNCKCRLQMMSVLKELRTLSAKVRDDNRMDMIRMEWRFAARVIDRVCLILFSIVNIVCTCLVLFSSPPFGSGQTKPAEWPEWPVSE